MNSDEKKTDVDEVAEPSKGTIKLLLEEDGKLVLQENALKQLLNSEILRNLPIAVVSIAGAFRMGKSFMLNLCLHYFRMQGWKDRSGSWLNGWTSTQYSGIEWKGGTEGHTEGIVAWTEPIIVERTNGSKLAVILLDTQGNFDHGQKKEKNVGVFALSTLFSSLQIFNISKQIQANDLEYLQCFVEFAKCSSAKESQVDSVRDGTTRRIFQDLLFLVRDWQYPVQYPYGAESGDSYLNELSQKSEDGAYSYLNHAFNPPRCYLMPQPADCVRFGEKNIVGSNMGIEFCQHVVAFMEEYMHPDKLVPKCLGIGVEGTASTILHHVRSCADKILSGEHPDFPNLMNLIASRANQMAVDISKEDFKTAAEKWISDIIPGSWEIFDDVIASTKEASKSELGRRIYFGIGDEQRLLNIEILEKYIVDIYPTLVRTMEQKRCPYAESETKKLINECSTVLKKRKFPFTDTDDLKRKGRKYARTATGILHERDCRKVEDIVRKAKREISTCCKENIGSAERRNSIVRWIGRIAAVGTAGFMGGSIWALSAAAGIAGIISVNLVACGQSTTELISRYSNVRRTRR